MSFFSKKNSKKIAKCVPFFITCWRDSKRIQIHIAVVLGEVWSRSTLLFFFLNYFFALNFGTMVPALVLVTGIFAPAFAWLIGFLFAGVNRVNHGVWAFHRSFAQTVGYEHPAITVFVRSPGKNWVCESLILPISLEDNLPPRTIIYTTQKPCMLKTTVLEAELIIL